MSCSKKLRARSLGLTDTSFTSLYKQLHRRTSIYGNIQYTNIVVKMEKSIFYTKSSNCWGTLVFASPSKISGGRVAPSPYNRRPEFSMEICVAECLTRDISATMRDRGVVSLDHL